MDYSLKIAKSLILIRLLMRSEAQNADVAVATASLCNEGDRKKIFKLTAIIDANIY